MKRIKLFFSIIAAIAFVSCSDYLEVKPNNALSTDNFYQTEEQMDQALTGIYSGLMPISLYRMALSEYRSDNVWMTLDTKENDYNTIAFFNVDALPTCGMVEDAWADYYKIVARANEFLSKLDGVEYSLSTTQSQYEGEARFLRALAYFDLVRLWGNIPVATKTVTQKEAFQLKQSTEREVYDNVIIPDLRFAIENLAESAVNFESTSMAGRATQQAAKALLGKVYLTMAGFPLNDETKKDSARILFEEVIDYSTKNNKYWASNIDEWNRMWVHENDNKYFIFEIQYAMADGMGNAMTPFSIGKLNKHWSNTNLIRGGNTSYCEPKLKAHFMDSTDNGELRDKRAWNTIITQNVNDDDGTMTANDGYSFYQKFFENKIKRAALGLDDIDVSIIDYTYWPQDYPLLRIEDCMLLYAEIVGNTEKGRLQLNKIRERAGLDPVDASMSEADFQTAVENERRYEFAGESERWFDLVRKNKFVETLRQMLIDDDDSTDGKYKALVERINSDMYLLPIPQGQIDVRDGLYKQNKGY